jgi:hypothetical protein
MENNCSIHSCRALLEGVQQLWFFSIPPTLQKGVGTVHFLHLLKAFLVDPSFRVLNNSEVIPPSTGYKSVTYPAIHRLGTLTASPPSEFFLILIPSLFINMHKIIDLTTCTTISS